MDDDEYDDKMTIMLIAAAAVWWSWCHVVGAYGIVLKCKHKVSVFDPKYVWYSVVFLLVH